MLKNGGPPKSLTEASGSRSIRKSSSGVQSSPRLQYPREKGNKGGDWNFNATVLANSVEWRERHGGGARGPEKF